MTIDELLEEIEDLQSDNGCCLHIAIVDYNLGDDDLRSCERFASEANHAECLKAAISFREMIPEDRREAFLGVRIVPGPPGTNYETTEHLDTPWRPAE